MADRGQEQQRPQHPPDREAATVAPARRRRGRLGGVGGRRDAAEGGFGGRRADHGSGGAERPRQPARSMTRNRRAAGPSARSVVHCPGHASHRRPSERPDGRGAPTGRRSGRPRPRCRAPPEPCSTTPPARSGPPPSARWPAPETYNRPTCRAALADPPPMVRQRGRRGDRGAGRRPRAAGPPACRSYPCSTIRTPRWSRWRPGPAANGSRPSPGPWPGWRRWCRATTTPLVPGGRRRRPGCDRRCRRPAGHPRRHP